MSNTILALVDDLITASRIEVEVKQAGGTYQRVGTQAALLESVRQQHPALILVDLDGMGFDGVAALEALKDEPRADGIVRIAYGSHVAAERLIAAKDAGADSMARSQFVKTLGARVKAALG